MGNSGSAHNLHIEGVSSELNSFYQQRRRVTKKQLYPLSNETSIMVGRQKDANIDWTMSLPHSMATGVTRPKSGFETDLPKQFKVLPHLSERHKLRSTTNGAILHSGGTISGRKDLKGDDEQSALVAHQSQNQYNVHQTQIATVMQQRSRSFILESKRDTCTGSNQEGKTEAQPPPVFRRARTLLHFNHHGGSCSDDKQRINRSSYPSSTAGHTATTSGAPTAGALQHDWSETDRIKCSVTKLNKYNKKRKAPPAPALASATHLLAKSTEATATIIPTTASSTVTQELCSSTRTGRKADEGASSPRMKTRLFRTNAKAYTLLQQQLQLQRKETPQSQQPQSLPFHRSTTLRASTTSTNSGYKLKSAPLLPLRREKSSDAILLRSNGSCAIVENAKELLIPPVSVMNERRASREPFSRQLSSHIGKTASRIPQLKRTFYFGMNAFRSDVAKDPSGRAEDVHQKQQLQQRQRSCSRDDLNHTVNKVEKASTEFGNAADSSACRSPSIQLNDVQQSQMHCHASIGAPPIDSELVVSSNNLDGLDAIYDIDKRSCEEDIEDNGLFVHVRPTLPRRQLETPSFSPAAAWRMLVDLPANQQPLRRQLLLPHRNPNTSVVKPASAVTSDDFEIAGEPIQLNGMLKKEPPIRIASTIEMRLSRSNNEATIKTNASAWTPQQDLDDEEDEYNENGHKNADDDKSFHNDFDLNENHVKNEDESSMFFGFKSKLKPQVSTYTPSASMHVFSLSLPRDAHTHLKSISNGKIRGFNSLQKQKCSGSSGKNNVVSAEGALAAVCELRGTENSCGGDGVHYRSDNWVLHHRTSKIGSSEEKKPLAMSPNHGKFEALPSIKPISLSYLTGGKHVIYLPGNSRGSNNNKTDDSSMLESSHKRQPNHNKEADEPPRRKETQRKREARIVLQSLQDETPTSNKLYYRQSYQQQQAMNTRLVKDGAAVGEKSPRYSFQSTVRLLEKRRLAEKLSKDAEIREAQRKSELEAMKRVEEDFQRKRAFEKASIRHQLRLYFSGGDGHDNDQFISLPLATKKSTSVCHQEVHQEHAKRKQQHDANNNDIFCRADPDGAVSSPSPTFPDAHKLPNDYFMRSTTPTKRFDSDCGESDNEFDIASFKRTASLVEPYLQSIIK